jgi:hypothetical protein
VPPEATMRVPPWASRAANSAAPRLSDSDSSAARGQAPAPAAPRSDNTSLIAPFTRRRP